MVTLYEIIVEEIMWATKAVHSIESGYSRLETAEGGRYRPAVVGDDAYYVCALFNDGRHIPLPLLIRGLLPAFLLLGKIYIILIYNTFL